MLAIKPTGRVAAGIFFFVSILVAPWWFFGLVGLVGLALFDDYYELIIGAFMVDVLYGKEFELGGWPIGFSTILLALILVVLARTVKKRLIFYQI